MNIVEVHRKVKDNIGDAYCNPSRYFHFDNLVSNEVTNSNLNVANKNLIIGGGGLIHKGFQKNIINLLDQKPNKSALWGIGHNFGRKHVYKSKDQVYYPNWIHKTDLIGIRDWIEGYEHYYLPCVSCMHPAFDKTYTIKRDVVFFIHTFKTNYNNLNNDNVLQNKHLDFEKAIKFLGEAETVVTDSYHGAYWAQLLGKDVRTVNWSVKFDHFKYSTSKISKIEDWHLASKSIVPDNFLSESRKLNKDFYQKVLNLFLP